MIVNIFIRLTIYNFLVYCRFLVNKLFDDQRNFVDVDEVGQWLCSVGLEAVVPKFAGKNL
jgi:hypothetical protein